MITKYRCTSTGESSHKFGPCEVCGGHVPEVFIQSEMVEYLTGHFTYVGCKFGHAWCLKKERKPDGQVTK